MAGGQARQDDSCNIPKSGFHANTNRGYEPHLMEPSTHYPLSELWATLDSIITTLTMPMDLSWTFLIAVPEVIRMAT